MGIKDLINSVNKESGANTIRYVDRFENLPKLSTGIFTIDSILCGGIPRDSMTELLGWESTGKSTFCYHVAASAQALFPDQSVLYIDMEHAVNPSYAARCGVDTSKFLLAQPDDGTSALHYAEEACRVAGDDISLIIIDSIAALITEKEFNQDMGDANMGTGTAKMMASFCRKIPPLLTKSHTTLLMVNQWREKPGVMYGDSRVPYGGNAIKYTAKVRIDLRTNATDKILDGKTPIGQRVHARVLKNKSGGQPNDEASYDLYYGEGIDQIGNLIDYAINVGIIKKAGSWFKYNDENIAQGRASTIEAIKADSQLFGEIADLVTAVINASSEPTVDLPEPEAVPAAE